MSFKIHDLTTIQSFRFERLLNEDPAAHSLTLLGTFPGRENSQLLPAILRVERTPLSPDMAGDLMNEMVVAKIIENTDIYSWLFGWLGISDERPDVKINVVCPATDIHIRKYMKQEILMVRETPELYHKVVKPYVLSFPAERTQWVEDILLGQSEADKVLYDGSDFLILPDMKWDLTTLSALYLVAIVRDRTVKSLRDLRKKHLEMLKNIQTTSWRIVQEKWNMKPEGVMLFVHYQPSYYHFHVHIVHANQNGRMGMGVGQAHLLDNVISLLEVDSEEGPSVFERMTLTYGLGDQHRLYERIKEASL